MPKSFMRSTPGQVFQAGIKFTCKPKDGTCSDNASLGTTTISIMTFRITALGIMTISIMTKRIMTLSIKGLFVTHTHKRHSA
jgi:hypothetical protein